MKPGEFVGRDGRTYTVASVALRHSEDTPTATLSLDGGAAILCVPHLHPDHPDFPAAVEALAKLVPEPFEWEPDGTSCTRRCVAGHVELKWKDGWVEAPVCTADFNAGRRYERERGHADE